MKTVEYQILKYRPDIVTGEFVNVGIVLFCKEENTLKTRFDTQTNRAAHFFNYNNTREIKNNLKILQNRFDVFANDFTNRIFEKYNSITAITESILVKDDSSYQFSHPYKELTLDVNATFEQLYQRYILKHTDIQEHQNVINDDKTWQTYKHYFKNFGIDGYFTKKIFTTKNDSFEFDSVWKNDKYHVLTPLSLDIKEVKIQKEKIYKWIGKTEELEGAEDNLILYFLAYAGAEDKIREFANAKLNKRNCKILFQESAEKIAGDFKKQIDKHLLLSK
ncbi:MAG: DUF3037 domain-containing protein [bacterium]